MSLSNNSNILEVDKLKKWFSISKGFSISISRKEKFLKAVDDVTFNVKKGEIIALAGESGSGKTTTGRLITRLLDPTSGSIRFEGVDITKLKEKTFKSYRRKMQMIFQNPFDAINPRLSVFDTIKEPLMFHDQIKSPKEQKEKVKELLTFVKLTPPETYLDKFPSSFSGGELQRICIARALILNPEFILADEPVSMLDVSVRAGILNFFTDLRDNFDTSIIFITHDIAMASYVADRMMVMYMGKLMEEGPIELIISNPLNPYTRCLIASVPHPDPTREPTRATLKGEPATPIDPPLGCRFNPRCPNVMSICRKEEPTLRDYGEGHKAACFLYDK